MECARAEKSCQKVLEAVRAVEMHMALPCIAMRIYRAFPSALLEKPVPARYVTREHLPKAGCQNQLLCAICENIFSFFRKTAGIAHSMNNSSATGRVRNLLGFMGFISDTNF